MCYFDVVTIIRNNGVSMNVGDKRWYVFGYERPLAIRVTITLIDEYDFCWIDEPLGHSVSEDEFYTCEEAICELNERKIESEIEELGTLDEFRESSAEFILSTWKDPITIEEFLKEYPEKIKDVDWFN